MATPAVPGATNLTTLTGDEIIEVATSGPQIAQTTFNAVSDFIGDDLLSTGGTFVANEATAVPVANTAVTANSIIVFGLKTVGGAPAGAPYMSAVTPGTGFSVKAAVGDTSTYNYLIIN